MLNGDGGRFSVRVRGSSFRTKGGHSMSVEEKKMLLLRHLGEMMQRINRARPRQCFIPDLLGACTAEALRLTHTAR
jgi:hypothetical protein